MPNIMAQGDGSSITCRVTVDDEVEDERTAGGMNAAKVTIRLVPDGLPSDAHKAAWMADQGCESQARALLASLN